VQGKVVPGLASGFLHRTKLSCQCVKLVGKRHTFARQHELAFANHMHQFDAGQNRAGRSERLEAEHRPRDEFDRAVILRDNVVEIFDLPVLDRYLAFLVQLPSAAWLAPLLSMVTLSGTVLCRMAFSKKRLAAAALVSVMPMPLLTLPAIPICCSGDSFYLRQNYSWRMTRFFAANSMEKTGLFQSH